MYCSTILVETNCRAAITEFGDINMSIGRQEHSVIGPELDMIQLSIFSHRFMSIAEQMGRYVSINNFNNLLIVYTVYCREHQYLLILKCVLLIIIIITIIVRRG